MAEYLTEAVVLTLKNWNDYDKIVTFLTKDRGKIRGVAYGCRRPRSLLAGTMQPFMHLNVVLRSGANLAVVKQTEIKEAFRKTRESLDGMAYATFLAELATELCPENQPEPEIFERLTAALALFAVRNPRLVALAAAYQMLDQTGQQASFNKCALCGGAIADGMDCSFAARQGGVVCGACSGAVDDGKLMPSGVRQFIGQLLNLDLAAPAAFTVNGTIMVGAEAILLDYLLNLLEKPLKSLTFIRQLTLPPHKAM